MQRAQRIAPVGVPIKRVERRVGEAHLVAQSHYFGKTAIGRGAVRKPFPKFSVGDTVHPEQFVCHIELLEN